MYLPNNVYNSSVHNCSFFWLPVYMDRYGDCFHEGPIRVQAPVSIYSQGGSAYDTLTCEMRFQADKGERLCLTFKNLLIQKCGVNLYVFSQQSSSGTALVC